MNPEAAIALRFHGVEFGYDGHLVLEDVNLEIPSGALTGIVGPNGGGKTTLLRLALGFLKPSRGRISVLGVPPEEARERVGYVPQYFHFDAQFPVTAMDVVRMGRLRPRKVWGFYSREDRQAAWAALEQVELAHLAGTAFGALSGGQRQRVLVARALALRPALLLLDEPTANVDPASQHEIYDLMQRLSGDTTVIMVTHDMNFVSSSIRQVVCVNRTVDIHPTTDIPSELSCHLTSAAGVRFVRHDRSIRDRESP